jgi:hypothetical protein
MHVLKTEGSTVFRSAPVPFSDSGTRTIPIDVTIVDFCGVSPNYIETMQFYVVSVQKTKRRYSIVEAGSRTYSVALTDRTIPLSHPSVFRIRPLGNNIKNQPNSAVRRHIDATGP